VSANLSSRAQRGICLSLLLTLGGCSWFTDFKEQPKIDPWDTPNDSTPPRGQPQGSVPMNGSAAPEFLYARNFQGLTQMSGIANPVAASQESVDRGRKAFQVNCAACHGPAGAAGQSAPMFKFGIYAPSIGAGSNSANALSDGYIFGIIRNGRGLMPTYNRIEESTRWDIVNYIRTLQGKTGMAADTSHGRPGETGQYLVGATLTAPTRPAPFFNSMRDTTKPPAAGTTPPAPANKPPTPEAKQ
jgi:mono/diheme cytochrome c family protein